MKSRTGLELAKFLLTYAQRHGDNQEHEEASRFLEEISQEELADAASESASKKGVAVSTLSQDELMNMDDRVALAMKSALAELNPNVADAVRAAEGAAESSDQSGGAQVV